MNILTNEEKIMRYDTLVTLRQRIGSCFGTDDGLFANHISDENNALELLEFAIQNNILIQEIIELAFGNLYEKNYPINHIEKELTKIKVLYKKIINQS